jgi:hypothetical protein
MDEYLFMAMAKLKADRMKLEHEQREQLALQPTDQRRSSVEESKPRVRDEYVSRWNWSVE